MDGRPLVLTLLLCWMWAAQAEPVRLSAAHAHLVTDDAQETKEQTSLGFRWDRRFPGRSGTAKYTVALPPMADGELHAVMFEGVGNQARVRVDGATIAQWGTPDDPRFDAGKAPQLVVVPASLRSPGRPTILTIDTTVQALRGAGLMPMHYGTLAEVAPIYRRARLAGPTAAAAYGAMLLLMGGLAAGLWWRQRDRLYGCFALAALFGVARNFDQVFQVALLPWRAWGALLAAFYGAQLALTARFIALLLEQHSRWLIRVVDLALVATVSLAILSFALLERWPWNVALAALEIIGVALFVVVLREALVGRRAIVWLVLAAGSLLLVAGGHDLLRVRFGWLGSTAVPLAPHALFFFVLMLAGIVVQRYSNTLAQHRALSERLAERVAQRERELKGAFEALRVQQEQQAVFGERQRMMREIHDGIGSQLVGLLGMVERPTTDRLLLQEQVKLALDEMRMAVDSLQPVHDDLTIVLATLRYRLQPRLEAAGVKVVWNVGELPPLPGLQPQAVLQLQRILLEAFTNVLKHARATSVVVEGRWREQPSSAIVLRLTDDGIGPPANLDTSTSRGQGIKNMRTRAESIGARLSIERVVEGGTSVAVEWPVPNQVAELGGLVRTVGRANRV